MSGALQGVFPEPEPQPAPPPAISPAFAAIDTDGTASGAAPTRFRIFKRGAWRKAFRLEDVFWHTLERAAAAEGLKLADYVRRLTAAFGPQVNISSQMRVRVVEWLARRCQALEEEQSPERLMASVLAAPIPCFVISAGRDLVRSNAEFQAYVEQKARGSAADRPAAVTMALDAPVQRVIALLAAEEGRALACGFTIRVAGTSMTGRARVTLLPPGKDLVVCYVLPDETA